MSNIQALSVDIKEVGKKIKSSKKRFTWCFTINGKRHTVDLFVSKLSGKKKLLLDGRSIHEEKNIMASFCQRFEIDGNAINVQTKGDSFEMVFNKTQTFSELYTQAKTKSEFQEEEGHFDSYDNDFIKEKPTQSKFQGFNASSYQPPSKNSQDLKGFKNNNSNFNNNDNLSDGSNSADEPSSGGHKSDNLRINKGGQSSKVDSKKDSYAFDSGFDKYDWKSNTNKQQVQKPKQNELAFDNFNNQFSNPQRNQQQQQAPQPAVVQPKQKVPPTTDFSKFTFGGQPNNNNNKQVSQSQPQQSTQQSASSQAKSAFDAFGAPNNTSQPANGGQKSTDPFQDFFKQGNENIFANSGNQYNNNNNKATNNPSNAFNNFGQQQQQQPIPDSLPQQQKVPSQQQIVQQPPVQQQAPPVKQQQQVNVFDLLGDDEPSVPPQQVQQQQQIQPQAVQQPTFQAQPIQQQQQQQQQPINNLVNLVNNLSINPTQNQPNLPAQPTQPQATNLLNMYEQSQQNQPQQQQQQQQQKPQGSNYDALYAASNPFGGIQQQQPPQQSYVNYTSFQQGYGQQQQQQQSQQQQYNPFAQQYQPPVQQNSNFQQQTYQQQQFQPQQAYQPQNNYGYNNNNIGLQGGAPIQFQQQQVIQQVQVGQTKTPFDDLF